MKHLASIIAASLASAAPAATTFDLWTAGTSQGTLSAEYRYTDRMRPSLSLNKSFTRDQISFKEEVGTNIELSYPHVLSRVSANHTNAYAGLYLIASHNNPGLEYGAPETIGVQIASAYTTHTFNFATNAKPVKLTLNGGFFLSGKGSVEYHGEANIFRDGVLLDPYLSVAGNSPTEAARYYLLDANTAYQFVASASSEGYGPPSRARAEGYHVLRFAARDGTVPEPATWGLMILGLGGVGASLRRARRVALA